MLIGINPSQASRSLQHGEGISLVLGEATQGCWVGALHQAHERHLGQASRVTALAGMTGPTRSILTWESPELGVRRAEECGASHGAGSQETPALPLPTPSQRSLWSTVEEPWPQNQRDLDSNAWFFVRIGQVAAHL